VARQPTELSPQLEAMLDERDHLRIKINLAEGRNGNSEDISQMRRLLANLEREIDRQWGKFSAERHTRR